MREEEGRLHPLSDGTYLIEYDILGSTQDEARARVKAGEGDVIGVRAHYQSAGRGRRGARWEAPAGTCLLVTYILRSAGTFSAGRLAFAAAAAICEAIETQTGLSPSVKWPNDVLLSHRKIAGILVETNTNPKSKIQNPKSTALVGIGLNVNVQAFPEELAQTATSLLLETGRAFEITAMEEAVRRTLFAAVNLEWREILRRWRARDTTPGLRYQAAVNGQEMKGTAAGVSDIGALVLLLDNGTEVEVFSAVSLPVVFV
jgi:BirA family biotin operon repressor/biotin-[acetyl-CoA-carboxylase] ligase